LIPTNGSLSCWSLICATAIFDDKAANLPEKH